MSHPDDNQGADAGERLEGIVERVVFHNEDSGFCVLRVRLHGRGEPVTVLGNAATVGPGEQVACRGEWVNDRRHGLQFKTRQMRVVPPATLQGMERYLASGMVRGIGAHFASKLVRAFGEQVFEIIEHQPERLRELEGIGPKRQQRITRAWAEQRVVRDIMVFLQSQGVGTARAVRIYKTYGDEAIARVRENPYRLSLDIHGIGFKSADGIARRLGIPPDSPLRAQAGVRHVLQGLRGEGHCAAPRESLVQSTSALLGISAATIERAIDLELAEGNLMAESLEGRPCVYLAALYRAEVGVAQDLLRLLQGEPPWGRIDPQRAIPQVERDTGLALSASQRRAVAQAVQGKVTVITGGPGVGKTTVVNTILRILRGQGARVLLCAPTGRAAKRLSESTGLAAKTIHRLLEFDPGSFGFKRGRGHPLEVDLLVMDESSMVDVVLMGQLLQAVPDHAALLLVGDQDQLPSVGPGNVLGDVIDSGRIPIARLTEIFRQAASSRIIVNAHRINQGLLPERPADPRAPSDFYFIPAETPERIQERLMEVVTRRIPRRFALDPVAEVQVLTPMHRGPLGSRALNERLQRRLNPEAGPTISRFGWTYGRGDKVIQTANNYDKEVFNGDTGRITGIDLEEGVASIRFDGRELGYELSELDEIDLAYAITVHKSQGSEYPAVVIPLATQHAILLQRNLLYTAVTRGARLVVIVGQPKALAMAVHNLGGTRRLTHLAARLAARAGP